MALISLQPWKCGSPGTLISIVSNFLSAISLARQVLQAMDARGEPMPAIKERQVRNTGIG